MKEKIESLIGQVNNWQIEHQGHEAELGLLPGEVIQVARNIREVLGALLTGDKEITITLSNLSGVKLYPSLSAEGVESVSNDLQKAVYSNGNDGAFASDNRVVPWAPDYDY